MYLQLLTFFFKTLNFDLESSKKVIVDEER